MTLQSTNIGPNPQVPGTVQEVYIPDQLIAGNLHLVTDTVTLLSGSGVIARGTVLGRITASGKYIPSLPAAVDGSQNPVAIASDTVDATSADQLAGAYFTGEFSQIAIVYTTWTLAALKAALANQTIYLKSTVIAADPT